MSENTQIVIDAMAAFNAGDLDDCLALIHPDLIMNLAGAPEPLVGRDLWLANLRELQAGIPDLRMQVRDAFGSSDRVAIRNVLVGTHTGPLFGMPATGRLVSVASNELYRVRDGLIVEEWIVTDTATLFAPV
jgi:steroid delta-isomerase-like uncharacterized protein